MEHPVIIERHEYYSKQSYRNRCTILTANGLLDMVVPVVRTAEPKMPITEVAIAYDTPWQKLHFKAIESAYRRSPFYQYYIDELMPFFATHYPCLYDFNMQIMRTICRLTDIPFSVRESDEYSRTNYCENPDTVDIVDFRDGIHPKKNRQSPDPYFTPPHYTQVFSDKYGFVLNLSILDLLFNVGCDVAKILYICTRKQSRSS
jgi:hypothetical protein